MKRDINEEINKLLSIQSEVDAINRLRVELSHFIIMSQDTYNNLSEKIKMTDLMFYVVPDDIAEYVDEDIVLLENDKILVVRDGKCINTVELGQ